MNSLNAAISFGVTAPSKLSMRRSARHGSRYTQQTTEHRISVFMVFMTLESIAFLHTFAPWSEHEHENLLELGIWRNFRGRRRMRPAGPRHLRRGYPAARKSGQAR